MTVISIVAVSVVKSAAVPVIVYVVRPLAPLGVPVMRQVEPFTATARPVGRVGDELQVEVADPVFVKEIGVIAKVAVYVCADWFARIGGLAALTVMSTAAVSVEESAAVPVMVYVAIVLAALGVPVIRHVPPL